ncbi:hypothetical protein RFH54_16110 [Acinetobacter soli]|uniref:hypothetical protein n=1 Tax=Acinetobacter soli TaxID=487316 RepID=UPI00280DBAA4|nr:hypothetical protein [Acinetobacter soli]MDQ8997455.1 hypothetical protein [Acinetobacter soli]
MTFIVAIQLNDSIIITADNKKVILKETGEIEFKSDISSKIYAWDQGVITGTGESYVINRAVKLFKKIADSTVDKLPQCLDISRQIRELEVGKDHYQIENTKILCSSYSEKGAQLYIVQRFESSEPYTLTTIQPMDITVWLFHPNIEAIAADLQNLYIDLKDYAAFTNKVDWINYYINRLAPIYKKQSQQDPLMSRSFDFFFQSEDEYITGHIPNTQEKALKFQEIATQYNSI